MDNRSPVDGSSLGPSPHDELGSARRRVERCGEAFCQWQKATLEHRSVILRNMSALLLQRRDNYAHLMATEMGKPVTQGRAEIDKCAAVCSFYAEHAAALLRPESVSTEAERSEVHYRPLGVVLAIMPWNFPFWQVFRCLAPTLMAGNGVILKHASNVPGCARAIADVCTAAGLPEGLFAPVFLRGSETLELIAHPTIAAVTLTGSTAAGRSVASAAGQALKPTVLELGGSDPYLVLEDADVEEAARICAKSRLINSGQSCIAAKRFIVVENRREQFEQRLIDEMGQARVGDPSLDATEVGPLAREDLRDEVHAQVERSIATGCRLRLGGQPPQKPGAWYPPTVLTDVTPASPAYREEVFGPVAAVIGARDTADAVRVANDSSYGLGAAVFTRDRQLGLSIAAEQLAAGSCFVNTFVRSDPRLPFGGIKESGYGRELGLPGIRAFVNAKTVFVARD